MIAVNYPQPSFKLKREGGKQYLFDAIRKIWVLVNDEEWVRQNFIQYMVQELHYPSSMIAVEKEISLYDLKKRFDILVYDRQHQPWMMIECKAPSVELKGGVLEQLLRYHISIPVSFLVITNGNNTYAWEKRSTNLQALNKMPEMQ